MPRYFNADELKADLINIRNMIEGGASQMPHFVIGTSAEPRTHKAKLMRGNGTETKTKEEGRWGENR